MMYLARREHGKIARIYQVYAPKTEPRTWEFSPHLGHENLLNGKPLPSLACRSGFAALASTPTLALNMLHSVYTEDYT